MDPSASLFSVGSPLMMYFEPREFPAAPDELSFTAITRHINAVLRGEEEPRRLAVDTALITAQALHDVAVALGSRQNAA